MVIESVLSRIDAGLDASLERLFELVRIKSISADPDYKEDCSKAAEWCVGKLGEIGIDASVRKTIGHPMVVGHYDGAGEGAHLISPIKIFAQAKILRVRQ